MNQMISIIVPVYNAEGTLDRCIDALKKQTYKNIEIILVNDGSKDTSLQICEKHSVEDARIHIIDKKNGGVSSARNAGLDIAQGAFVMFCDSDDWAEPEWCEELLSHYEDECLVMCGHYVEGNQKFIPHEIKSVNECDRIERSEFYKLKLCNFNAPWNKIYKMDIIKKNKLCFDERFTNGEDYLFILRYLDKIPGDIIFLNRCVFHYEWPREQSLSCKVPDNYLEQCCLLSSQIMDLAEKIGLTDDKGKKQLKTDFFYEFQKILMKIINNDTLSSKEKIREMSSIMSTREYQKCAAEAHISRNRMYSYLSRKKNGKWLWLWHQIRK